MWGVQRSIRISALKYACDLLCLKNMDIQIANNIYFLNSCPTSKDIVSTGKLSRRIFPFILHWTFPLGHVYAL